MPPFSSLATDRMAHGRRYRHPRRLSEIRLGTDVLGLVFGGFEFVVSQKVHEPLIIGLGHSEEFQKPTI